MHRARLDELGFERLTNWVLRKGQIKPSTFDWDTCSGWIYAFVVEGRVRYIGITTTILRSRLDGYSYQRNDGVGAHIRTLVDTGSTVDIFGLRRPKITGADLEEEESRLIFHFETDWNVRR